MVTFLQEVTAGFGRLLTGYRLLRLQRRVEAVLVTDRAVLVFGTERARTEAAAVELADFHEGCRGVPVLPVVLVAGALVVAQRPLPFAGASRPLLCTRLQLPGLLEQVRRFPSVPEFDPAGWEAARYRPVPGLIEAACRLYAGHDVAALLEVTGGRGDLERTRAAVSEAVGAARAAGRKVVVFVTGAPGAGKTLCGLDLVFSGFAEAVFLTANPALLQVLRAALLRDAVSRGMAGRAARQRVKAVIQPLHEMRDAYLGSEAAPPERLLVIDEAQRCWTAAYALRKTRNRVQRLLASEPALLLESMGRHQGWCAVVCLIGSGQEIHAGEGGLAAWGEALVERPEWGVVAPPGGSEDKRQRLPALPGLVELPALHLGEAVRAWRMPRSVAWVEAVLANRPEAARRIAMEPLPFRLTRSLAAMRGALRAQVLAERPQRAGLLASSGARRLRAEGVGGLLWHQDEDAVASWFLDAWPDIRSSDALEVAGTEFGVQGLELDHTGLCWDLDLARTGDGAGWQTQAFRGTKWTAPKGEEDLSNRLNAYRVLMTRARRSCVVWVPEGDAWDGTRDPGRYDAVAAFLSECGMLPLELELRAPQVAVPEAVLL